MAPKLPQDRLVRKEVALGFIREIGPPTTHRGLELLAPWLDVESDDVIFDYATGLSEGLAPARAEDAESELAQKDDTFVGIGRASIIDWSLKDHYDASDVTRYREALLISDRVANTLELPLTIRSMTEGWEAKQARDTLRRKRKLDNRIEWLIMTALETGGISYNDGKIKFTVDYGRPANQHNQAPASGHLWNTTDADPIGDVLAMQEFMYDTYGVRMTRGIASRKILNAVINSDRFIARTGLAVAAGGTTLDPRYLIDGWGPEAALAVLKRATGVDFIEYDSVYRTRNIGSTTFVNNRFLADDKIYFLPSEDDVDQISDTDIGFAKTLTSPHPEGNFTPGFYEWEKERRDPWGTDFGTGVKAFPVFPHMDLTYVMDVL